MNDLNPFLIIGGAFAGFLLVLVAIAAAKKEVPPQERNATWDPPSPPPPEIAQMTDEQCIEELQSKSSPIYSFMIVAGENTMYARATYKWKLTKLGSTKGEVQIGWLPWGRAHFYKTDALRECVGFLRKFGTIEAFWKEQVRIKELIVHTRQGNL